MKQKLLRIIEGYTKPQLFTFSLVIILALSLCIYLITSGESSDQDTGKNTTITTKAAVQTSNPYSILAPATVASKTAECSVAVTYDSSGTPGPLECSNGDLNIQAWSALSAQEPEVMSLGYSPSLSQVQSAICSDANASASDSKPGADNAIETAVYQLSALYYGWTFSPSPTSVLTSGGC